MQIYANFYLYLLLDTIFKFHSVNVLGLLGYLGRVVMGNTQNVWNKMKFYLKIFGVALLPVLIVAFFFVLSSPVLAADTYVYIDDADDSFKQATWMAQNVVATNTLMVSGIELDVSLTFIGATSTGFAHLCNGECLDASNNDCYTYCDEFDYCEFYIDGYRDGNNNTCYFDNTFELNDKFYVLLEGFDYPAYIYIDDSNPGNGSYMAGTLAWTREPNSSTYVSADTDTINFNLIYNTNIPLEVTPDNEYLTIPDPTLDQWRSDVNTAYDHICFLDEPCEIWFSFNDKAIGKTVYITPFSPAIEQFPEYAEASTTIQWVGYWQTHADLPAETVATTTKHCIYLEDSEYGDFRLCGITTQWISEEAFMDGLEFDVACNCDSVATSSGSYWDDMRYGVECGARKIFCWMFLEVDPDAIAHFKNKVKQLEQSFPLNTFFSITDAAQDALASSTLDNSGSIDLIYMDENQDITFVPAMTSSSMPNLIGEENANDFRLAQQLFLWGLTAAFLVIFSIRKFL